MNQLSFKEQVFLVLLAKSDDPFEERESIMRQASQTAFDACAEWGHVPVLFDLDSPGAMTLTAPDKIHLHHKCARCGRVIK